jgi:flagellar basal body-associated protein FliL
METFCASPSILLVFPSSTGWLAFMAKSLPKKKKNTDDWRSAYIVAIAVFCLVVGFLLAWSQLKHVKNFGLKAEPPVAYTSIGPMVVHLNGYEFSASMAIQTREADAEWINKNKDALNDVLHSVLVKADPQQLRQPNGLLPVQEQLKKAANAAIHGDQIQNIYFTDFVMESDNLGQ